MKKQKKKKSIPNDIFAGMRYGEQVQKWADANYSFELKLRLCEEFARDEVWGEYAPRLIERHCAACIEKYRGDYRALAEVVISLSLMCALHEQMNRSGWDGQTVFIALYNRLFDKVYDEFIITYEGDADVVGYLIHMKYGDGHEVDD